MNRWIVLFIRAILGAGLAVLLSRFFYPQANPVYVAALGFFLVGMAYVAEALRGRRPKP